MWAGINYPPSVENAKLGDWKSLFSVRPSVLLMHDINAHRMVNIVTGEVVDNTAHSVTVGPFGPEKDTNNSTTPSDYALSSSGPVSVFTFVKYNSDSQDHTVLDFANQFLVFWADTQSPGLRPAMFAGSVVYGTSNSLDPTAAGYKGMPGYHCWGAVAIPNDAASAHFVNGVKQATGNPGTDTAQSTGSFYCNSTGGKNSDANYIWTIAFEGLIPDNEAIYLTANPEAIYSILEPINQVIFIPDEAATPATGDLGTLHTIERGISGKMASRLGGLLQ